MRRIWRLPSLLQLTNTYYARHKVKAGNSDE